MIKRILSIGALALVAACSGDWETNYEAAKDPIVTRGWHVHGLSVTVPDEVTTTEENSLAPNADIVWHGEPYGDRKAQAAEIVRTGAMRGVAGLRGRQGVDIQIVLEEFHALTPRARADAPSAVHNITYTIQVFDEKTGEAIIEPERIRADLIAYTGAAAIEAVTTGQTQKVRITDHIERVMEGWLGIGPDPRNSFGSVGR